jgi:hypothetical protein
MSCSRRRILKSVPGPALRIVRSYTVSNQRVNPGNVIYAARAMMLTEYDLVRRPITSN